MPERGGHETTGLWRASAQMPAVRYGPAAARRLVGALLPTWGLAHLAEDAKLVVSELFTNAIQHAPGPDSFDLELIGFPGRVRIALADGSAVRPVVAELEPNRPSGRGMRIVAALAESWGAEDHRGGKRVWVDLVTPEDEPTTPGQQPE